MADLRADIDKSRAKEAYWANPEAGRARNRAQYEKHRDVRLAEKRAEYAVDADAQRARNKAQYAKHAEKRKAARRARYAANRATELTSARERALSYVRPTYVRKSVFSEMPQGTHTVIVKLNKKGIVSMEAA